MRKKIVFVLLFLVFAVFISTTCVSTNYSSEPDIEKPELTGSIQKIGAYVRSSWGAWNADQIQGQYLTDLVLAFTTISDSDHTTLTGVNDNSNWHRVSELKDSYPHLKINMSVGGWGADNFSQMSRDPQKRAKFIENCMALIKKRDLDGLDVDWEFPVGPANWGVSESNPEVKGIPNRNPPITVALEDRENYIFLLQELRNALDALGEETTKVYSLSTCVPAQDWFITRNDVAAAAAIVDFIKIMAYDYEGNWSSRANFHANLHPPYPGGMSSSGSVEAYIAAGVPPQKIMLGLATYGKEWQGVAAGHSLSLPGFNQTAILTRGVDVGYSQDIKKYLEKGSGFTRYWHNDAQAAYLFNPTLNAGTFICYLDEQQIKAIVAYAKEKGLGGIFYWEWYWDQDADLLKVMCREAMNE